jgi:(E)-4-hydroxy-3-methyl-but-2-enyl pyrophosphate reductase
LTSWANNNAVVLKGLEDIKRLDPLSKDTKLGVIAQTTQSFDNFQSVAEHLRTIFPDVEVHNTICDATSKRQSSAIKIAQEADVMLVIGDFQSANTKRLAELCKKHCRETYQVQNKEEIDLNWLKNKRTIGITAGASTPMWVIDEVVSFIKEL